MFFAPKMPRCSVFLECLQSTDLVLYRTVIKSQPNVGKHFIHGASGKKLNLLFDRPPLSETPMCH